MKKDILFGGIYFFLFVYVIFTAIGYNYFPEISAFIKADFGPEIFPKFMIFVILSFFTLFLVFFFFFDKVNRSSKYRVINNSTNKKRFFFLLILIFHLLIQILFFSINYDELNYSNFSDEDFQSEKGISITIFGICFKQSVSIIIISYIYLRLSKLEDFSKYKKFNKILMFFAISEVVLFLLIATKVGNRTDILAVMISIFIFEYQYIKIESQKIDFNKIIKLILFVFFVLYGLSLLSEARTEQPDRLLYEKFLLQDYYAPAHILLGAIAYDFISPLEVIYSNTANALIKIGYPYLQTTVADLFNPGASTRSASYAFYLFSEGYLFMGFFGFIYNGITVFLGISLWKKLTLSQNVYYNLFMISIVAQRMVTCCRSQSSYFVKDLYYFFIPAIFFIYLISGLRPKL
ncbi:hypothetical protein [Emticicia oligotrophica]|uniref:hypothetical protein n=1 Tax=Emticicia oligotrophica TaxID=312279 RepID=UPI00273B45DC|nr:hypothetical protein [Emticicia oligotrophica]